MVVYGLLALSGPRGIQALVEKHREIRQLQEQNAALDSENKARKEKIERLANSRDEQGLVIRKQRKQVRPGEKTYVIQDEPAQTPANP